MAHLELMCYCLVILGLCCILQSRSAHSAEKMFGQTQSMDNDNYTKNSASEQPSSDQPFEPIEHSPQHAHILNPEFIQQQIAVESEAIPEIEIRETDTGGSITSTTTPFPENDFKKPSPEESATESPELFVFVTATQTISSETHEKEDLEASSTESPSPSENKETLSSMHSTKPGSDSSERCGYGDDHSATSDQSVSERKGNESSAEDRQSLGSTAAYDFTQPDAVIDYNFAHGSAQLEAYKLLRNDDIFARADSNNGSVLSQLAWVSVGHVRLIKAFRRRSKPNSSNVSQGTKQSEAFRFTKAGFSACISSLKDDQRDWIAKELSRKYITEISRQQVRQLIPDLVTCCLQFFGNNLTRLAKTCGHVHELSVLPWRVEFDAPEGHRVRLALQQLISHGSEKDVRMNCELTKYSSLNRHNSLHIIPDELSLHGLDKEKLLGGMTTRFVTRQQLIDLSVEIAAKLDVYKSYDIPSPEIFHQAFTIPFIEQFPTSAFDLQPVDSVLANLSPYRYDAYGISGDIKVEQIKQVLSRVFQLIKTKEREHIIADRNYYNNLLLKRRDGIESGSARAGSQIAYLTNLDRAVDFTRAHERAWETGLVTSIEQLQLINRVWNSDITWEFEGMVIRPAAIAVATIDKSSFERSLHFPRISRKLANDDFHKAFRLYTGEATEFEQPLIQRLENIQQSGTTTLARLTQAEAVVSSLRHEVYVLTDLNERIMQEVGELRMQMSQLNASRYELSEELLQMKEDYATNEALERMSQKINARRTPN